MKKPLITVPQEILRKKSVEVTIDKKTTQFIEDLRDTLLQQNNPKGVGLSAPQIGKNWKIFATLLAADIEDDAGPQDLKIFINPLIISHSSDLILGDSSDDPILEGCLSIPNIYGPVPRYSEVTVEYQTLENGQILSKRESFNGFFSRVIQHEYDHLEGILFTDHTLAHKLPLYEHRGKRMIEIDSNIAKAF
jgi:peptide deformylase